MEVFVAQHAQDFHVAVDGGPVEVLDAVELAARAAAIESAGGARWVWADTRATAAALLAAGVTVWTVAAADPHLRDAVLPMERTFAREVHEMAVRLLEVDDTDPHRRALIQVTLELARGLALANLLTDDTKRRRRVVATWADQLADALGVTD